MQYHFFIDFVQFESLLQKKRTMVKITICLLVVGLSAVLSAPAPQEDVQILRYDNNFKGDGNYIYTYELSNGQIHSEVGSVSNDGEGPVVVEGSYSFVAPDGVTHWVNYTADEEGFKPVVGQGPGAVNPAALKSLVG